MAKAKKVHWAEIAAMTGALLMVAAVTVHVCNGWPGIYTFLDGKASAWAQVAGGFLAVGAVIWVSQDQARQNRRLQMELKVHDEAKALAGISAIIDTAISEFSAALQALSGPDAEEWLKTNFTGDDSFYGVLAAQVRECPLLAMPNYEGVITLIAVRDLIAAAQFNLERLATEARTMLRLDEVKLRQEYLSHNLLTLQAESERFDESLGKLGYAIKRPTRI